MRYASHPAPFRRAWPSNRPALVQSACTYVHPPRGRCRISHPALDWNDPAARSDWLAKLWASLKDGNAVTEDMLLPPRERQLGPALHARNYADAWAQVREAIAYAMGSDPDPEGGNGADAGDPAGAGGSPAH